MSRVWNRGEDYPAIDLSKIIAISRIDDLGSRVTPLNSGIMKYTKQFSITLESLGGPPVAVNINHWLNHDRGEGDIVGVSKDTAVRQVSDRTFEVREAIIIAWKSYLDSTT